MPPNKNVNKALLALTVSALAIPGMSRKAQADTALDSALHSQPDAPQINYRFSAYREDDIPGNRTAGGRGSARYEVDSQQLSVAAPIGENMDYSADVTVETMSGASPWFVIPGPNGKPLQVMSGASIHDIRESLQLRAGRRFGDVTGSLLGGYSSERDYRSANGGLDAAWNFNDALTTLDGGASYTHNIIDPTASRSSAFPNRIAHADSYAVEGYAGVSQVLTAETVIQTSVNYTLQDGYLSDPYKLAYVAGNTVNDARPRTRHKLAWITRLRQHVPLADATVHLDYRYFHDDWQVTSHTVDLAWYQDLPDSWLLVPRVRWYSQSQAYFYAPYYNTQTTDGLYSSDYRLSPFGALDESLSAYKRLRTWTLSLRYEHYDARGVYSIHPVGLENPGLVRFQTFSVSIGKTF